jgi:Ca2+-binding RTX toxin-like protein
VVAFAAAGDDRLDGGPGDDTIQGGQGNDRLSGGSGNDTLGTPVDEDVEVGDDRLLGGPGDDGLDGGPGFDRLNGQAGVDSCANGEVLVSCEASAAAAASQPLATTARAPGGTAASNQSTEHGHGRRASSPLWLPWPNIWAGSNAAQTETKEAHPRR